tara:strand:- start:2409 stop:3059 length:651 start_codon:yes stop_codon:yes gene_type:complete
MLSIQNLKLFSNSSENMNLSIEKGSCVHVSGEPGSGKTKLFKILTGTLRPIQGDVLYNDTSIYNSDFIELGRTRKMIGAIFENPIILSNLTLKDNIDFVLKARGVTWDNDIKAMIRGFNLDKSLMKRRMELCRDEIVRFNLLKIISTKPSFIFFDELCLSTYEESNNLFLDWLKTEREKVSTLFFGHVPNKLQFLINQEFNIGSDLFNIDRRKYAG